MESLFSKTLAFKKLKIGYQNTMRMPRLFNLICPKRLRYVSSAPHMDFCFRIWENEIFYSDLPRNQIFMFQANNIHFLNVPFLRKLEKNADWAKGRNAIVSKGGLSDRWKPNTQLSKVPKLFGGNIVLIGDWNNQIETNWSNRTKNYCTFEKKINL